MWRKKNAPKKMRPEQVGSNEMHEMGIGPGIESDTGEMVCDP